MDVGTNNGYDSTARYTAYFSLFIGIILIILIIIFVVYYVRDPNIIAEVTKTWTNQNGSVTSGDSFTASPNSIYLVNNTLTAAFNVTVVIYPTFATDVANSNTTIFIINNTTSTSPQAIVTIVGVTVQGTTTAATISPGTSGEYMWINSTTIRRIF